MNCSAKSSVIALSVLGFSDARRYEAFVGVDVDTDVGTDVSTNVGIDGGGG